MRGKPVVASLFSGCGGSSLGYKQAGFDVRFANEFVEAARDCYRLNFPETHVDERDVRLLKGKDILDVTGPLDLLDGSPPCQSFSTAGSRHKKWEKEDAYSDTAQRCDDLFFEYIRLVKETKPRVFVAENVAGLAKGKARGYLFEILKEMRALGYTVDVKAIDASYFDVPQARVRLIFQGVKNGEPVWPDPSSKRIGVSDVCKQIVQVKHGGAPYRYRSAALPSPTIAASDAIRAESAYLSGGGWVRDKNGNTRKFTIAELKKISTFPASFKLTGTFNQKWERIGRAVPPRLMYAIASAIHERHFT